MYSNLSQLPWRYILVKPLRQQLFYTVRCTFSLCAPGNTHSWRVHLIIFWDWIRWSINGQLFHRWICCFSHVRCCTTRWFQSLARAGARLLYFVVGDDGLATCLEMVMTTETTFLNPFIRQQRWGRSCFAEDWVAIAALGWGCQGRIQQVAEGAQAPPWLGKIICLCLTHWQIEVKIEALSDLVLEAE